MNIIDAHQHYWTLNRGYYDWLTPDLEAIYRDFLPHDMAAHLSEHNIAGTIVVQAAASEAETHYLFELANENPSIIGVVGWLDMDAPDAIARLDRLVEAGGGLLKGIRPMIQDITDPNWILKRNLNSIFQALADRNLVFDALVSPIHLRSLADRLSKHPNLKTVIDHGGKPPIAERCRSAWAADLERIAKFPNTYCKLSGLLTEAGEVWVEADIRPYISEIFHHFSPRRVMWGSDWPVLNLASNYNDWFGLSSRYCERFTTSERAAIFGGNALEIYGLKVPCPT